MSELREIEREAAAERQRFASSLDALTSAVAPENIKAHAMTMVETHGSDIAQQAWSAARKNPAGFALIGAGLTLLLAGVGSSPEHAGQSRLREGLPSPEEAMIGFDERVAAADAAMSSSGGNTMSDEPKAKWLRDRIEDGLDALPPKARMRVREARQAAVNAQEKVEDRARQVARQSSAAVQSQPLAVGAVAFGIGAVIGALLPSSRREDALMGEHRDRLMAKARGVLNEEMDKLHAATKSKIAEASPRSTSATESPDARP